MSERTVFVLGGARSGTTWIAKILDSHPDVLYRHEPDIDLQDYSFPTLCETEEIPRYQATASRYLERLIDARSLRTAGGLPVFPKSFHGALAPALRRAFLLGLRAMEEVRPLRPFAGGVQIPDFVDIRRRPELRLVMKSVSALGRAGLFAAAMPRSRFVLILRHPCGQVASLLRGRALGKFEGSLGTGGSAMASTGRRYGLTPEILAALSPAEQHAWDWAIMNEFAMDQLRDAAHFKVIRYEDFCADPEMQARELLHFAQLAPNPQTDQFVRDSTSYSGVDRYYQIFKNTNESAIRWKKELDADVQESIMRIVRQTRMGAMFSDIGETVRSGVPQPGF
ncbi:sulfotransferase [Roseomonas sp. CAU 1739]|uniref:sulfotransferase n=1 Tax=Roseomonas sp. CAU 1739 TaxID=3140364 RepID=UPI00325C33E8